MQRVVVLRVEEEEQHRITATVTTSRTAAVMATAWQRLASERAADIWQGATKGGSLPSLAGGIRAACVLP